MNFEDHGHRYIDPTTALDHILVFQIRTISMNLPEHPGTCEPYFGDHSTMVFKAGYSVFSK